MSNIYIIAVLLALAQIALTQNPLGNCLGGRGVPYTLSASKGACMIDTIGIPPANVDETFYAAGAQCGVCYEVTGPWGVRTVQVLDKCDSNTPQCQQSGKTNFGIDEDTFSQIANRSSVDIIYDLGFREVTCAVTGNIRMKVEATESSLNYFSVSFTNFRVGITDVRVKGDGWSGYDQLKRQGTTAIWAWNKDKNTLRFPITLYLVGRTSELVSTTVSSLTAASVVDFGTQFTDVNGGIGQCPMTSSPGVIYTDSVSYGWDTSYTFNPVSPVNPHDTSTKVEGEASLHTALYGYGGLQFTRTGGFDPLYFSHLTFAAKSNGNVNTRIYMGSGTGDNVIAYSLTIGSEWTRYNVSVTALTNNNWENNVVFQNMQDYQVEYWFDDIRWIYSPTSPLDNVTQVTTGGFNFNSTTGDGPVLVDTSSTTRFSFGDNTSDGFVQTANLFGVIVAISAVLACML